MIDNKYKQKEDRKYNYLKVYAKAYTGASHLNGAPGLALGCSDHVPRLCCEFPPFSSSQLFNLLLMMLYLLDCL